MGFPPIDSVMQTLNLIDVFRVVREHRVGVTLSSNSAMTGIRRRMISLTGHGLVDRPALDLLDHQLIILRELTLVSDYYHCVSKPYY